MCSEIGSEGRNFQFAKHLVLFDLPSNPDLLEQPDRWITARTIFVNSMSDIFHEDMPEEYLDKIFNVIELTPHHTYQILTKRADRMFEYFVDFGLFGEKARSGSFHLITLS